ncbi:MAG: carbohydrate porin [Moorea sp. SIO4A3]|nr:carbohydrate porin [Moorena sp. SIO4A3]
MDLTSYFDRNSFAKDSTTHFFNPVFQTNPALAAAGIASRPGVLLNWNLTDNLEVRAAGFSSDRDLDDFAFDGFSSELAFRVGTAIIRGTYLSARDAQKDGFQEIFSLNRGDNEFGPKSSDREEAYGINGELYIPALKMGLFGRYGWYENLDLDKSGDTYSVGLNFLDLFMDDDRLGLGYGRQLSNDDLRQDEGNKVPDVWELFYDVRVSPNVRAGVTLQGRDEFSDTILGVRVRADFDVSNLWD